MSNKNFEQMKDDNKVIFFLGLSEKVVDVFSREEDQKIAQGALDACWEWLKNKENIGESLYDLLDDEEKGIVSIQEMSEVEKDETAWNCIIDSVAFTSRKAFEGEGAKYFPEPI
ncbi:Imm6 family immunity protein [Sporolactobacillus sp. CQH2019]|uniref:Imm6 family immunity protein n=1 Tax=Sporolactobacillus sp. CQH2019 TaxID=3023512 RepID=UPI002367C65C|nr:Imm6 family immunity protein [Sporolactobacillus sp. CQH2019]MDD9149073.1 Imm6 family immunity protein [Sporolactobacillus sp. CQH2019]